MRNAELFRELQASQSRLLHSEKLNAAGRMAAGIAHEINSPLTCILGSAQVVLTDRESRLSAQSRADLETIMCQARRCGDITRSLLEFVHRREPRREIVELRPLIEASADEVRRRAPAGIEIVVEVPERLAALSDPIHLRQVLANLLRNAAQAMESCAVRRATVRAGVEGGAAVIRVEDTGPGLPEGPRERLFEPFFTTKALGKGTGLGLYLCRMLIERSGGRIAADDRARGGAVFTVELPLARSDVQLKEGL
ncbi:MAG: hypothetical protein KGM24_11250 [Elusimicrobia bacterium]|nr:hypothetical protein [Elusimicrobiota bacterium]